MGQFFDTIPESMIPWIEQQKLFFVATAPLAPNGHVNVSPKGVEGTFHIVDDKTVWYEDLTGSGIETISHIRENGRITIMFCAFEGMPRILRLFGTGSFHEFGTPEYHAYLPHGRRNPGSRAVIVIKVHMVGTSCGFSIPIYEYKSPRNKLLTMCAKIEDTRPASDGGAFTMQRFWEQDSLSSIDGLVGLKKAHLAAAREETMVYRKDYLPPPAPSTLSTIVSSEPLSASTKVSAAKRAGKSDWRLLMAFILGIVTVLALEAVQKQVRTEPWVDSGAILRSLRR